MEKGSASPQMIYSPRLHSAYSKQDLCWRQPPFFCCCNVPAFSCLYSIFVLHNILSLAFRSPPPPCPPLNLLRSQKCNHQCTEHGPRNREETKTGREKTPRV